MFRSRTAQDAVLESQFSLNSSAEKSYEKQAIWPAYWTLDDIMGQYDVADIRRELEVMTAVARIVGTLDQPAARERVIRWAAEKFHIDIAATPPLGNVGAPIEQPIDPDDQTDGADRPAAAAQVRGKEPLDAIVQEIAADLQRLALGSHGA